MEKDYKLIVRKYKDILKIKAEGNLSLSNIVAIKEGIVKGVKKYESEHMEIILTNIEQFDQTFVQVIIALKNEYKGVLKSVKIEFSEDEKEVFKNCAIEL